MLTIKEIIHKEPFSLTVLFSNGEIRKIDFTQIIQKFPQLSNKETFMNVMLDDYPTLSWKDLAKMQDYDGKIINAPLDFSPDTLYEMSEALLVNSH